VVEAQSERTWHLPLSQGEGSARVKVRLDQGLLRSRVFAWWLEPSDMVDEYHHAS
jgi:hypothetical protein